MSELVKRVEALAGADENANPLQRQQGELNYLCVQYNALLDALSNEETDAHELVLTQLKQQLETIRATLTLAVENERVLLEPENGKRMEKILEGCPDWSNESLGAMLKIYYIPPDDLSMEIEQSNGERIGEVQEMPALVGHEILCETSAVNQQNAQENQDAQMNGNAPPSNNAPAVEPIEKKLKDHVEKNVNVKNSTVTNTENALASALKTSSEFTYYTLLMYNTMINELQKIEQMPAVAQAVHFQRVRGFITRFVNVCAKNHIDLRCLEPILLSHIIASFNETVFSNWKFATLRQNVSLRSIREFLVTQEEMANDRWFSESRFHLANAVRAAQSMIEKHDGGPAKPNPEKSVNEQPLARYTGAGDPAPGCSNWASGRAPRSATSSPHRLARVSQPGSGIDQSKGAIPKQTVKRDTSVGEAKEKRKLTCLGCGGPHPLYFCKRFLQHDVPGRWEIVNEREICPLCLIAKHNLMNCPDRNCGQCGEPHNSKLCEISYENEKKKRKDNQNPPKKSG